MKYYKQKHYKNVLASEEYFALPGWSGVTYENGFLTLIDGNLDIQIGYAWDGASGPVVQTKQLLYAALLHDALYQIIRQLQLAEVYRSAADREFRDIYRRICLEAYPSNSIGDRIGRSLAKMRSVYIYNAVKWFGKSSVKKPKPKKIYEV